MKYRESVATRPETAGAFDRLKRAAHERFRAVGLPRRPDDAWKYVDLNTVLDGEFAPASVSEAPLSSGTLTEFVTADQRGNHLVFMNGFFRPDLSSVSEDIGAGVRLTSLGRADDKDRAAMEPYLADVDREEDAFSLINAAHFRDGAFLFVPRDTTLSSPVHLWFLSAPGPSAPEVFYPRNLFVIGSGSRVNIVAHMGGRPGAASFMNADFEAVLFPSSSMEFVQFQKNEDSALLFTSLNARLAKDSHLKTVTVTLGGHLTRNRARVRLEGRGASASLRGLSILKGASQVHHHTEVTHDAAGAASRQLFKNILRGETRSEYTGLVHVTPGAAGSDSNQLTRNLVLAPGARAHARPQLRIDADDVKCTHGATVGRLSEEEIFYLRTRGLSHRQAQTVLTFGFAEEVIEAIESESLRKGLEREINAGLGRS